MPGKFKKIELYGFKSFADKHEIPFNDGVTVIVGPNGCGKSNVSDSVRWVLGEQSAKQLRGSKMQDVIFSGTEKRRSMSYCEVLLTFDNKDKTLFPSLEYDDVVISRKLYRSGESEYAVNKIPTRLKDIVEMLRDANMGREGYSIIGQGRVQALVSAKPEDRRAIFEEAAGIAKYKQRKRDVENKLARTRENLQRVSDILSEKRKQLDPLLKQAENAKKWLELHEQVKHLEINTFIYQRDNASEAKQQIDTRLQAICEEANAKQKEYENTIVAYDKAMADLANVDKKIAQLRDEQLELTVDLEKQNGDKKVLRERLNNYNIEITRLEQENAILTSEISKAQTIIESGKIHLADKKAIYEVTKEEVDKLREEYNTANEKVLAKERETEENKQALVSAMERLADIKSNMSALTAERNSLSIIVASLQDKIQGQIKEVDQLNFELNELTSKVKALKEEAESKNSALKNKREELAKTETELADITTRLEDVTAKYHSELARKKVLSEMQEAFEGYNNSIKYLMNDAKVNPQLKSKIDGVVAQLITVDEIFESAIEMALGGAAQNIVTENEEDAKYIIEYLKKAKYGRITFLPLTSIKPRSLSGYENLLSMPGCYGVASDIVKYDKKYANIVSGLLGSTVVVDNMDTAVSLAKKSRYNFKIVTLEGDVISSHGSITGGSKKNDLGNLFSHDRELNQTKNFIEQLATQGKDLTEKKKNLYLKKQQLASEIEEIFTSVHGKDIDLAKMEESISKLANIIDEKSRILAENQLDENTKSARISQITNDIESVADLEETVSKARKAAVEDEQSNKEEYERLKSSRDEYSSRLTEERLKFANVESELNSALADIARLESNLNSNKEKVQINTIKLAQANEAVQDINERLSYVGKNDQAEAIKRIEEIKGNLAHFDSYKIELNVKVNTLNDSRSSLTEKIQQLQEKKAQQEYMLVRVDADIEQMQQRILEEYHLEYADCLPYKQENYNFEEGVAQTAELKRKMSYLGHINVEAIEQSKEVGKEYEELNTQKEDLEKAAADAEVIIKSMTEEMLATFNTEFEKIRVNFIKIFKELFGGGEADLQIIEDSDDPLEYGINILASPPGKKIMSNNQLSGGEQSLTAIAILFAILRLKPMPFCILDEIDSALDDANIGRYAKYLKRFSQETQFIVITHRKPTMEVADNLYGVTMEERGVSKIISVKLSEAATMAEEKAEKVAK